MIYLELLWSYMKIGFFGFGGGYAMLSLISDEIVVRHGWITAVQFSDIIAVSQMTPGPIAINCATYVGYLVTGNVWGSLMATFAVSLPPMTIMMAICRFYVKVRNSRYMKGTLAIIKPVTVGMIGAAALMLCNKQTFPHRWVSYTIFAVSLAATWKKVHPIIVISAAAVAGLITELF